MQHDLCNLGSQIQIRILPKERTLCQFFAFFYGRKQRTNRQFHETRASLNFSQYFMRPGRKDYENIRLNNGFRSCSFKILSQRRSWEIIFRRAYVHTTDFFCWRQPEGWRGVSTATEPNNTLLCYYSVLPNNNIFRIIMYSEL